MSKVNINQIESFLSDLPTNQTIAILSKYGVSVGSAVQKFADEHSLQFSHVRLSAVDPIDLQGIDGFPPAFFPTEPGAILLFSDLDIAPPEVLALVFQIVVEHAVGSHSLAKGCRVVLSAECPADGSAVSVFPLTLANKLVHIFVS